MLPPEMVKYMKEVAQQDENPLTVEQRNLLSVAYKNVIGSRRASWRIISSVENKVQDQGEPEKKRLTREYREKIEEELTGITKEVLQLLDEHLLKQKNDDEATVFYHKMYASPHLDIKYSFIFQERRLLALQCRSCS